MKRRALTAEDLDILHDLQEHYSADKIKIDYDIANEPCIFYNWFGAWNIVYKLSLDGSYLRNKWSYVTNAHYGIQSFIFHQRASKENERQLEQQFLQKRDQLNKE